MPVKQLCIQNGLMGVVVNSMSQILYKPENFKKQAERDLTQAYAWEKRENNILVSSAKISGRQNTKSSHSEW